MADEANPFDQYDSLRDPAAVSAPPAASGVGGTSAPAAATGEQNPFDQYDTQRDVSRPAQKDSGHSAWWQLPAGFNQALASTLGGPVDLANWMLFNAPGIGLQARGPLSGGPKPSPAPLLGSESIKQGMGLIGANPDTLPAISTGEKLLRGVGEGAGSMVAPELALGSLGKAFPALERGAEYVRGLFGRTESAPQLAKTAVVGGAGGGGGEAAAEVSPDWAKPTARVVGSVLGGGSAALATGGPRAVVEAAQAVRKFAEPFTAGGQERRAGEQIAGRATDLPAVKEALETAPRELVPGSQPTTFQLTGDMGLGGLEREVSVKPGKRPGEPGGPEAFNQRRAEQNAARLAVLNETAPGGNPEAVTAHLRDRLADLDRFEESARTLTTQEAQRAATELGGQGTPEGYGAALREPLQDARNTVRAERRRLWEAVDPGGKLNINVEPVQDAARDIYGNLTETARLGLNPIERQIADRVSHYQAVVPFRELTDLRALVNGEMKRELRSAGDATPTVARLTQLRGAIQNAIDTAVEQKVTQEAQAVARGELRPEDTIAGRLPSTGNEVFTPSGRRVGVRYRVVEANDLKPATEDLQPRDRTRAASDVQIAQMANELQPERLGASASPTEGAPIVGPDGIIEAGNGRYQAIRQAHEVGGERSEAYRRFLEEQGYDTRGIRQPVLVRERTTELSPEERIRFAQESNASPGLTLSASERAAVDAKRLPGEVLDQYRGGDIGSAENRPFVRSFLRSVPEKGEEGGFVTGEGALSLEGQRRVQNALLHAAYGDSNLVAALAEAGDENLRAFGNVLSDAAGSVAKVRRGVAEGKIAPQADISPAMLEAAQFVQAARQKGLRLSDAVAQADAFNPISKEAQDVLHLAYGPDLSGRIVRSRVTELFDEVAREAAQQGTEARLIGQPLSASEILGGARARTSQGQPGVGGDNRAGGRTGGNEARGLAHGEAGPGGATARQGSSRVLEQPQQPALQPNIDEAARQRLETATQASREEGETYKSKPIAKLLKSGGMQGQYALPTAAVPENIFKAGAQGHDTVQLYRNAVGNDAQALDTLADYAASSLARFATRADGTIDPARFATWRQRHADALRAMPGLEERFATAARASEAMEDAAVLARRAKQDFQTEAVKNLLKASDVQDIKRTIGGIFERPDAVRQMHHLVEANRGNPEVIAGLRRAVIDHMYDRFVSSVEAGTSGQGTLKSDAFQKFLTNNNGALRQVLSEREVNGLKAIAADLQRANRSLYATKIPAGSNTTQDILPHLGKAEGHGSLLNQIIVGGAAGAEAAGHVGAVIGGLGAIGKNIIGRMRAAGIERIDELVKEAMLNPDVARHLLAKAGTPSTARSVSNLGNQLRRLAIYAPLQATKSDKDNRAAQP